MRRNFLTNLIFSALLAFFAAFAPTFAWADDKEAKAGAIDLTLNSGWVFNLAGARAISISSEGPADSGEHKTHVAPSGGAGVWITRVVGAYVDVVGIDGGTASATSGNSRSNVTDSLVGVYSGVKLQYPGGTVRPYVDFGGGVLHETLSGSFTSGNSTSSVKAAVNAGSFRFGGGVRFVWSKHLGSVFGVEGYHLSSNGVSRNYPRVILGILWQSK